MMTRIAPTMTFEEAEALDLALSRVALGVGVLQLAMAEGLEALARCGGHHELGFASIEVYGLERCERSARWVQGSRALARRLAGLPALRRAVIAGEIGVSMAQVIAGVACAKDEEWWLAEAHTRTVQKMRALVKERAENPLSAAGPPAALEGQISAEEENDARATLTVTVDREAGWLFEAARMLSKQMGDRTLEETLEALLAEGSSSLWAEMDRDAIVPFDETLDERAAQRAWESELSRFREEAEARCERRIGERPRARPDLPTELTWEGSAEHMDAQLRRVAAELVRRDLVLGELAESFWTADGWRRLGYATKSQYARERLGMSLSSVKAKRALARRARALPRLREAVDARELGYEAARLVASVASPETADAWVERARERTVKHLREETDAAQMLGRVGVDTAMTPPSEATMGKLGALERRIVSGATLQSDERRISADDDGAAVGTTLQSDERQISAGGDLRARGRVTLKFRVSDGTQRHYRWLERLYLRHGPRAGSFFRYLCLSFIAVWRERSGVEPAYAHIYARDLHRCTNPVCSRRDLNPHHLKFRSAAGDESDENLTTLCVWCHLEGVHGGRLHVEPPASAMKWRIGRNAHTVVHGRTRVRDGGA
jgi:hypothetical protein